MRNSIPIVVFILLLSCKINKQAVSPDDRLYNHVDSLMTQVLEYEYNEDSYLDSTSINIGPHGPSIFVPKNPEPLIVMNGTLVTKEFLNNYSLKDVSEINVINDAAAPALYGSRAKNGVIIISTKSSKQSKK